MIQKRACTCGKSDNEKPGKKWASYIAMMFVLLLWKTTQDSPKSRGLGREIREIKTMKHVDFCTACYEKKLISCNPHLSLNPNLTCVVSLYAKKIFNPITYFFTPGIIALECCQGRCQGRFDIFYMFACKSPGIFVYGRGWLGIFLTKKKKSCACTDLNSFIIFFTLWKLLLRE